MADMSSHRHSQVSDTSLSLLRRVRLHDPDAWDRFACLYTPLVYAWARRHGLQEHDAADVVQEVFQTVAQKIEDYGKNRDPGSFRGWLWVMTRNQAFLLYRRKQKQPEATGGTDANVRLLDLPHWDEVQDAASADEDGQHLLRRALMLIRTDFAEPTWQAFERTVLNDEPAVDVAASLGMTANAIRQAKFRVLQRLRDELHEI